MTINFEDEIEQDKNIDESNLIGELKGIKDILYKWSTRLAKNVNALKKQKINLDRLTLEKYKYYKHDYNIVLKESEIKLYTAGDVDIIKLKNEIRIVETKVEMIKTAVYTIREKSKTLKVLIDLQKLEML